MASAQIVTSLVKATEIIKCLCSGTTKISDISRKLDYNKTTVFKILNTFEKQGFATKDPHSRQYFPGPFLQSLGINPIMTHQILLQCCEDEMQALCQKLMETISLQIPYGSLRYLLHVVHTSRDIIYYIQAGNTGPLYAGAAGKVLLSQYEEDALAAYLGKTQLKPRTQTTPTDKHRLLAQVRSVGLEGVAVTHGESVAGGLAVAVPIHNYACPVALGVAGPEERMRIKTDLIIRELKASKTIIEEKLVNLTKGV